MCFEGTEEELKLTENTQPGNSYGLDRGLSRPLKSAASSPISLPATALANIPRSSLRARIEFADAVKLVRARGNYMQEAVPPGEGAMAAILGHGSV